MSEEFIVDHCSPTLAGIKTGSLFPCVRESWESVADFCRKMNSRLSRKGLLSLPLKKANGQILLYLYRPDMLWKDLSRPSARAILKEKRYPVESPHQCLPHLCRILRENSEFPHEIGLFLGYPPEDVEGFIRYKGNGAKCVGTWTVYGDAAAAERRFEWYKKCRKIYQIQYKKGKGIDRLTVSRSK